MDARALAAEAKRQYEDLRKLSDYNAQAGHILDLYALLVGLAERVAELEDVRYDVDESMRKALKSLAK